MPTITLHLDPDNPQEVAQARRILDRFTGAPATGPAHESVPQVPSAQPAGSEESVVADAVANLWSRTGLRSRELIKATAEQEVFSMKDIADQLGQPRNSIRSRFANLGRSVKAMQKAVPGAPDLYGDLGKRDGQWRLTMPEAYRNIVLRTDLDEPYSDGSLPT